MSGTLSQAATGAGWLGRARLVICLLLILSFVMVRALGLNAFSTAVSVLSMISIVLSLPTLSRLGMVLCSLFLSAGSWMLWQKGISVPDYVASYGAMVHLVALFSVVPVIAVPVQLGGYGRAISAVLSRRALTPSGLNLVVTSLAYLCGSFMTMAAVPIMMASIRPVAQAYRLPDTERFMAASITCSHMLPMMWSPVSGVVGAILYSLHVDWFAIVPVMLPLSVVVLMINWLVFRQLETAGGKRNAQIASPVFDVDVAGAARATPLLLQLALVILLLVCVIVGAEYWWRLGLVTEVVLLTIPFSLAWSASIGHGRAFLREAMQQSSIRLPRMAETFTTFLCGGFFATALHASGLDHSANQALLQLREVAGAPLFLAMLLPLNLLSSLTGLHPLVTISLLAEALDPAILGVPPPHLAIALIGSTLLAYMLGPFGGTLALVKSMNGVPTLRLGWWNLPYATSYAVLLTLTLMLL